MESSDANRVRGIDHVELFVPDLYEAAAWYRSTLGLEIVQEFEFWAEDSDGPLMISPAGDPQGTKLALFRGKPQGTGAPIGFRRVAFSVDGPGFVRLVDRLGVAHSGPIDHGLSFSIYFADPWGNRFEVTTYEHEFVRAKLN
jgi:catechol 2,3-dioxygenase-like lactoylglutathione lyase family enzyme